MSLWPCFRVLFSSVVFKCLASCFGRNYFKYSTRFLLNLYLYIGLLFNLLQTKALKKSFTNNRSKLHRECVDYIYISIHYLYCLSVRVEGKLEPIPVYLRQEVRSTLDRSPIYPTLRQTTFYIHIHT